MSVSCRIVMRWLFGTPPTYLSTFAHPPAAPAGNDKASDSDNKTTIRSFVAGTYPDPRHGIDRYILASHCQLEHCP